MVLDMNGVVSVFHSIFAAVREKDVTLCFDMGCGIAWSVNGMDVTTETTGDTNFSVKADVGAIPEGLIEETAGGFTVKWAEKTARTSGYQIQYSTSAGYKGNSTRSVFVKNASVTKQTVKNLKAEKKYYVHIRTYKTVNTGGKSTKIYSAWSSACKVKTLPAASGKKAASSGKAAAFLMVEKEDGKKRPVWIRPAADAA